MRSDLARLRDPEVFAERLIGEPLWPHQAEVAQSPARFRCICAGRQVLSMRACSQVLLVRAFAEADEWEYASESRIGLY